MSQSRSRTRWHACSANPCAKPSNRMRLRRASTRDRRRRREAHGGHGQVEVELDDVVPVQVDRDPRQLARPPHGRAQVADRRRSTVAVTVVTLG